MIRLSESRLHTIIIESINDLLLTESQESKSRDAAIRRIMERFNYDREKARETVQELKNTISSLKQGKCGRFVEGVARMYCDGQLRDTNTMSQLNATLKYVASEAHINEYDRNLNDISAQDLIDRFAENIEADLENDKAKLDQKNYTGVSEYDIVRIDSFEQAEEYYEYTYPESRWCLTYMEDMFENYTCGGINQIYFCLKKGFENIEPIVGEGCPLDEYGLSMLSVIVNGDGSLVHCTSRWNHKNGGSDNVMNTEEISDVIQMPFYKVFKPNTMWKDALANAKQRLANGEDPEDIFEYCGDFIEGFEWVYLINKRNVINQKGQLLTELPTASESIKGKWFDWCNDFREGYVEIKINNKYNFINGNGQLLTELPTASESIKGKWFDYAHRFFNGFAIVKLNDKYNYINQNGVIISDEWFDRCNEFDGDIASVCVNHKWYLINKGGKIISSTGIDGFFPFKDDFAVVYRYGINDLMQYCEYNLFNKNGKLITELPTADESIKNAWFEKCAQFSHGFAQIKMQGVCNYVNQNGELLSPNQWFEKCTSFDKNGFAQVMLNGEWYYIDSNGNITDDPI